MKLLCSAAVAALAALPVPAAAAVQTYTVLTGGTKVGRLIADTQAQATTIDFDVKNNGRGPTIKEAIRFDAAGLPVAWDVTGTTTFGSKIDEHFARTGSRARWTDSTGKGQAAPRGPAMYVTQSGSPYANAIYAAALLKADGTMPALPGGTLTLTKGESFTVNGTPGPLRVTSYEIAGIETTPETVLLDDKGALFGFAYPSMVMVREGYEGEDARLKAMAAQWATDRFRTLSANVAHRYDGPVRITNVRLFDPEKQALTDRVSVVVSGRRIASVQPASERPTPGETVIDGAGGTLVPGMYEMHAHAGQESAFLNLMAGVTSMRDMGNNNEVLEKLIRSIEAGEVAGPRITRTGFIEGKSPFSSNNGKLVTSEDEAVDAVRWYAARDFWAIKSYNSINPAWVPAMVKEAHRLGLKVVGHVPAFANADEMLGAGFDEMTHINQLMLGWVIDHKVEDTRTLFRLTALKRLPKLDLNDAKVNRTVDLLVANKVPVDVTLGIHENLLTNRDGQVARGAVDYIDHMPVGSQRGLKQAWAGLTEPGDDAAYRGAYDQIVRTIRKLHERGVMIVPGTDTGGAFTYHRELELYRDVGMTPPQILRRATLDMARYLGQDQDLGSIDKGKYADFFLVPGDPTRDIKAIKRVAMVVKDGTVYFPAEAYPAFGIKPFAPAPAVKAAK